jgi:trk system potassium uptake protein TrkH
MINVRNNVKLLSLPFLWMGFVQILFGSLSDLVFNDGVGFSFYVSGLPLIILSFILFQTPGRTDLSRVTYRDALVFAVLTWSITGVLGSIPIGLITHASITDSVFESVSALTTTGATILVGLDQMPKSFLLYRQFLQWMGGLGVVIFVVAVLPMLNIGGMRLLKAEIPGPVKDEKLTPRISNTAHYLWIVYVVLTVACAIAYYVSGMSSFDAVAHSFTTISTGGFSTHDASMGYFGSNTILVVSSIFMLLGAINFSLHFSVYYKRSLILYLKDEEAKVFFWIVLCLTLILAGYLWGEGVYLNFLDTLVQSVFHVTSFITSTGYGATDLSVWPQVTAVFLVITSYLGGCAGSTAGGNKIIRNIITFKIVRREFKRLVHPNGVFSLKFQGRPVSQAVRNSVMAFMALSATTSLALTLILMSTGLDFWSAFTAVAACINVLGPGFDQVASNFQPVSDAGTWVLSGAMILGRLEYFTLLALLFPSFWLR